jgi:hypothetical protein
MLTFRSQFRVSLLSAALVIFISSPAESQTTVSSSTQTAVSTDSDLRSEVEQLLQMVRDQQKRIDALEAERGTAANQATPAQAVASPSGPPPANNAAASNAPQSSEAAQPQASRAMSVQAGSSDERIRNLERQIKGLGPISFSGDVRLRAEPIFGGPTDQALDRARARVRVRFNALADLGSQFRTGITLASGDVNDPTSTNQTLTGFYSRKAIALDQAFVEFTPKQFKNLTVIGGKFRYPWYNTELTWDKDLNPEGAAQTLGFKLNTPSADHVWRAVADVVAVHPARDIERLYGVLRLQRR